jgi:hypothetical protein
MFRTKPDPVAMDALKIYQYDAILVIGLRTVDTFMGHELVKAISTRMHPTAKLCQFSDYPISESLADITFSTKVVEFGSASHHIGWGADPELFVPSSKDPLSIFIDHTHYVPGEYDNTLWILDQVKKLNVPHTIYRIGNNSVILDGHGPIEVFDRKGLPNKVYRELLSKSSIFFPTHRESVGLSVLEAAMSGCLIVSKYGFIYRDLLETVHHLEYDQKTDLDWDQILSKVDSEKSREMALKCSWDHVFDRVMRKLNV